MTTFTHSYEFFITMTFSCSNDNAPTLPARNYMFLSHASIHACKQDRYNTRDHFSNEYIPLHYYPIYWIFSIFSGQSLRIVNMSDPSVVSR